MPRHELARIRFLVDRALMIVLGVLLAGEAIDLLTL